MDADKVTISARIPALLGEELGTLSTLLRRNRTWVIEEALRNYIAKERQFIDAVQEGVQDMLAGNVVDHALIVADVQKRRESE